MSFLKKIITSFRYKIMYVESNIKFLFKKIISFRYLYNFQNIFRSTKINDKIFKKNYNTFDISYIVSNWNSTIFSVRRGQILSKSILSINTLYRSVSNIYYPLKFTHYLTFRFGFYYLQGVIFLLFIDACLTDDEPLWEPIEWSLVQTWVLIIFLFGWIAENLIVSRYGSYTGRDKRVWMSWYKTFWLIEIYYIINFGVTACFIITPFYFEINYTLPFIYSWWNWYSRVFFFKIISIFSLVIILSYIINMGMRWLNWRKLIVLVIIVNFFLSYLLYTHFIMSFFGYFTNPIWYQKMRPVDYIQLSHEPSKWGWGVAKRDHFTYHSTRTVFWFKNDGPFASTFLIFNLYLFMSLFFVYIYWISLFRRIYSTQEIPLTYTIYCISSIKQLFYCFVYIYIFVFISFMFQYWRLPIELFWGLNNTSWLWNLYEITVEYPTFFKNII